MKFRRTKGWRYINVKFDSVERNCTILIVDSFILKLKRIPHYKIEHGDGEL